MATIVPGNAAWKFYRERENDKTDKGVRLQDNQPEVVEFMAELKETHSELEHTYAIINRLSVTFVKE